MENGNVIHQLNYEYDVYHSYEWTGNSRISSKQFSNLFSFVMIQKGLSFVPNKTALIRWNDNIPISPPRLKSMHESRILIVTISEKYASSVFSLNELVEILNCMKLRNQMVCPVFVRVDPSDLRYLRNSFGEAMAQHERRFGSNSEDLKKWMSALFEISNLSGWHLQTPCLSETEKVVRWITRSLNKYDVFLSFSGTDTRQFTGFLYNALHRGGFNTFMEDEGWVDGEELSQFHIQAIEESKFSIIVIFNNYADSSCRLDALIKILERSKLKKQQVFPIFYKVDPSVVRHQNGRFHLSMAIHENRYGKKSEKVRNWKAALSEVASFTGWKFEENKYGHEIIEEIVELVNKSLPRYDVFLSFRGPDTRYTFTGWLYDALSKKGIKTFMDDHALEPGEQISQALIDAIQVSKFAIIVFSENYADSPWCLKELVNILEWKRKKNLQVWAIYYQVEPSDVCCQTKSYGNAMEKHEKRFGKESNEVRTWRAALSEVANLENWQFKKAETSTGGNPVLAGNIYRSETELINQIVYKILEKNKEER